MRAASERRGGEEGNEEVEVEEGGETEEEEAGLLDTPAVAAQHRRAECVKTRSRSAASDEASDRIVCTD